MQNAMKAAAPVATSRPGWCTTTRSQPQGSRTSFDTFNAAVRSNPRDGRVPPVGEPESIETIVLSGPTS